jgi:hypothetical protein
VPLPTHAADELACVAAWLDKESARVRLVSCDGEMTSLLPALARYDVPKS